MNYQTTTNREGDVSEQAPTTQLLNNENRAGTINVDSENNEELEGLVVRNETVMSVKDISISVDFEHNGTGLETPLPDVNGVPGNSHPSDNSNDSQIKAFKIEDIVVDSCFEGIPEEEIQNEMVTVLENNSRLDNPGLPPTMGLFTVLKGKSTNINDILNNVK